MRTQPHKNAAIVLMASMALVVIGGIALPSWVIILNGIVFLACWAEIYVLAMHVEETDKAKQILIDTLVVMRHEVDRLKEELSEQAHTAASNNVNSQNQQIAH